METEHLIAEARSWIGTPYLHQASLKYHGCDCLGLLRGIWRNLIGPEPELPPPYAPDWSEANRAETLHDGLSRHLQKYPISQMRPGDVLLFRLHPRGPAKHCAILATQRGKHTLIHARQNHKVSEEDFSPFWRSKLAFVFRLTAFS